MMRHSFAAQQWLPYPVDAVFAFFSNPENLPRLMPGWQKARIEEASFVPPPPRPESIQRFPGIAAGAGTHVTISFRPFPFAPFRVPWEAEIVEFDWNDHFCDLQLRGPFAYWRHCHRIAAEIRGDIAGTLLRDAVEYEMPLGPLGELAHAIAVRRQIGKMFDFRQKRTEQLMPLMLRPQKSLFSTQY